MQYLITDYENHTQDATDCYIFIEIGLREFGSSMKKL
jgi:hypothetical protein